MTYHTEFSALSEFVKWCSLTTQLPVVRERRNAQALGENHLFVEVISLEEEDYGIADHRLTKVAQGHIMTVRVQAMGAGAYEQLNRLRALWFTTARLDGVHQQWVDARISQPSIRGSGWSPMSYCSFTMGYTAKYDSAQPPATLAEAVFLHAEAPAEEPPIGEGSSIRLPAS